MDRVVWLVAGNKGGVGKSVVAKGLADWLHAAEVPLTVIEGDTRTPDVRAAFGGLIPTEKFDLSEMPGWAKFSDFLCDSRLQGHIVTNLPDAVSDRLIFCFKSLKLLAENYGFHVKLMFVINTLPDGLQMLSTLSGIFNDIYIVKNLYFGAPTAFDEFDAIAPDNLFEGKTIYFPRMRPQIMMVVRKQKLSFTRFIEQNGNTIYTKLTVEMWREAMYEALENVLQGS